MALVQKRVPAAKLVIIGEGEFRSVLERANGELRVGASFLGEMPQSEIRNWLEKARVFCVPSVTLKGGMSEAFGNVFSEAQAMGVPVVSFRHGGIPETMQEGVTGLLATERDVEQLAAHLRRFLVEDAFWAEAREMGMAWVREHFSVERQTEKLERLYDRAVGQFDDCIFAQQGLVDRYDGQREGKSP
jgi:glycosyltransferase involved in cell wall biosynthesis